MALNTDATKLADLIDPEVMSQMVYEKLQAKLALKPYVTIDTTLQGRPGSTITVPVTAYIGDAVTVAEGADIPIRKLSTDSKSYEIQKAGIGVILTDEAVLSGYGDPMGNASTQIAQSIASKIDEDEMAAALSATTTYAGTGVISYANIINALDLFNEETATSKVIFVHPKQVTQLRLDPDFISADKYQAGVMVTGEIGMIGGARIVPSKKVPLKSGNFTNPIIQLAAEAETGLDTPAITIYMKRDINIETERKSANRTTEVTGDEVYVATLTDETKVVLLTCKEKAATGGA